jgi:hypothetical protein
VNTGCSQPLHERGTQAEAAAAAAAAEATAASAACRTAGNRRTCEQQNIICKRIIRIYHVAKPDMPRATLVRGTPWPTAPLPQHTAAAAGHTGAPFLHWITAADAILPMLCCGALKSPCHSLKSSGSIWHCVPVWCWCWCWLLLAAAFAMDAFCLFLSPKHINMHIHKHKHSQAHPLSGSQGGLMLLLQFSCLQVLQEDTLAVKNRRSDRDRGNMLQRQHMRTRSRHNYQQGAASVKAKLDASGSHENTVQTQFKHSLNIV